MSSEADRNQLLDDHSYDGIQEYDNPTPGWWHMLFMGTVVFSVLYFVVYEMGDALPSIQEIAQADENEANARLFAGLGDLQADDATIARMMNEPKWMAMGASIFRANCSSCHGPAGQGNDVGPNMTDEQFKNVKTLADIARVIREGANNLAMPSWRGRLSESQIVLMSAYVASLRGQNLPGRAAEGEVIAPWPKAEGGSAGTAASAAAGG
jgi:cytochrome c oxidase cbb3-type subunit 3